MKKKNFRIFTLIFGSVLLIVILANFGINYWLKKNLPNYIKNNTSYNVTYQKIEVDLFSGNIVAEGITINNKNPKETKKLGLQGSVESLKISRLGIYNAIFNKQISFKTATLTKPILNITLPQKKDKTSKNPIDITNLNISEGKISIFKNKQRKLLSLSNLNLKVSGLELSKENSNYNLPLGFDTYSITGQKLFFRPNDLYLILADHLNTNNGELKIDEFKLLPLMSFQQFAKYYPNKQNLFNLYSEELLIKDFKFKNKKIALQNLRITKPDLKIYTKNLKDKKPQKDFDYDVNLENLTFKNAKIEILKPNQTPLFLASELNFNINKIKINSETTKEKIPFQYGDFNIDGENLDYFSNSEHLHFASAKANPKGIFLNSSAIKTTTNALSKNNFDLTLKNLSVKIKSWNIKNSKLKMEIDDVLVNDLKGKIKIADAKSKNATPLSFLEFPIKINKINLKNSDLEIIRKEKPLALNGLNLNINQLELSQDKAQKLLLKSENYDFSVKNFTYKPNRFYKISANNISVSLGKGFLSNFEMLPLVSRAQFIKMIPEERDLYDLKAQNISFVGTWDFLNANRFLNLDQVTLNKVNANIFRSKIPKDDLSVKSLYSKMLRSVQIPIFITNLDVKNSVLIYEEDIPTSNGPGKLLFKPFNMNIKNINSAKMKGKPTDVAISIDAGLMGTSPLHVNWGFDVADSQDRFTISGTAKNLSAERINPFIEPYLRIKATGIIKQLSFNFNGNPAEISGNLKMQHDNLKIVILKKDSKEKNKFLSAIANLFIKSDSDKFPASVVVQQVKRDNTKSFFNLLWKGLQDGLAQTLIGINYKKKVDNVKTTVKNATEAVKNVKTDVKDVKEAVKNVKEAVKSEPDKNK